MLCCTCYSHDAGEQCVSGKNQRLSQKRELQILRIFKRLRLSTVLAFVLMQANRAALMGAVQLQGGVNSPICEARQQFATDNKPLRVHLDFLRSPTAAVIASALLMMLIGWIDYNTTDFAVMAFYFGPVVLATWRSGSKAGWFIAVLSGATVLIADLMVPRSGRVIALSYINAGILVLASAALAELVFSYRCAHRRLEALLALRTVSLNEIHHRVKNNLQIVSSLLRLQAAKFADPAVCEVFSECRDRINAMARLHAQLYEEAGRSQLDFAPHLRELAEMLVRSHTPAGCTLALIVSADHVSLDLDKCILLSLIANELVLNALKHAFHGRALGKIDVELRAARDRVTLAISDDGIGFVPPPTSIEEHRGSGIELVRVMSRQLSSELVINHAPAGGTCATISFPIKLSRQQADIYR
jgi:two-component sensor histidine kinase